MTANSSPYWIIKPKISYTAIAGNSYDMAFTFKDNEMDECTINVDLGLANQIIEVTTNQN